MPSLGPPAHLLSVLQRFLDQVMIDDFVYALVRLRLVLYAPHGAALSEEGRSRGRAFAVAIPFLLLAPLQNDAVGVLFCVRERHWRLTRWSTVAAPAVADRPLSRGLPNAAAMPRASA